MGAETGIAWTDSTWNPVRGCSRVSEGCRNCYAEGVSARFSQPGMPYHGLAIVGEHGPRWTGEVRLIEKALTIPMRWRKPRRVFVNSMSDLFHEKLPNEEIAAVYGAMQRCRRHTFQVLTKRAARACEWHAWLAAKAARDSGGTTPPEWFGPYEGAQVGHALDDVMGLDMREPEPPKTEPDHFGVPFVWPLPNVWLGVSVENQEEADHRISNLLSTPAAVRFLSIEPQLGPVDLRSLPCNVEPISGPWHDDYFDALSGVGRGSGQEGRDYESESRYPHVDWVIVGGESGPNARPFELAWARSILDQCAATGVPAFCKQMGARPIDAAGNVIKFKDRAGADPSEWGEEFRVQEFPEVRS